ncbi:MAG: YwaF family protein [Mobilibacterium timonense]|uniref:TMEM164 family acyltransferase n=1 Tax=Mobilibacterium timonense TaxID=1871012 RepID=UPI002352C5B6|nr:YwaF family protein [Mobilibacterium timonense]MBM6990526.1 YwaF family protein [Mobilibacterium timonense]
MSDFFHYVNRTGYDHIYNTLSFEHMLIFVCFVLGFIQMIRMARRPGHEKTLIRLEKVSLTVMGAGQMIYFCWFFIVDAGGDKWPLYACRMACILLIITYFVRWMPLEHFSIYTALYGGISSVFYSTPKPFAFPHVTRIAFFMTHIGLAYSALLRILNHDEEIDRRSLIGAEIVNLVAIGGVLAIDIIFGWNYMFLMAPQLPTRFISQPVPGYLRVLGTVGVVAVYIFALFAAWVFAFWIQHKFTPYHYRVQNMAPSVRQSAKPEAVKRIQSRREDLEKEVEKMVDDQIIEERQDLEERRKG